MTTIEEEAAELADAVRAFRAALPDWWFTCGSCKLSGHATVGPDREGQDKDLLLIRQFDEGFNVEIDIDIEGGTPGEALRQATALAVEARKVWRS